MDEEERDRPWNFHTCKTCSYRSKSAFLLCIHVRLHQNRPKTYKFICNSETLEKFECEFCDFKTNLKVNLCEHFRVFHDKQEVNDEVENIVKSLHCTNCDFKTYSELVLTKHTDDCNAAFSDNSQVKGNNSTASAKGSSSATVLQTKRCIKQMQRSKFLYKQNLVNRKRLRMRRVLQRKGKDKSTSEQKSKRHCCCFCSKLITALSRHLQCTHKNEPEIHRILALPPSEKIMELKKLRLRGDKKYNANVEPGRRIPVRIPVLRTVSQYIECTTCSALIGKRNFCRHKNFCSETLGSGRKQMPMLPSHDGPQLKELFSNMAGDEIGRTVKSDETIKLLGVYYLNTWKLGKHYLSNSRLQMRRCARLLLSVKGLDPTINELKDCVSAEKYTVLTKAIKNICGFDGTKIQNFALALQFRPLLSRICQVLKTEYLKNVPLSDPQIKSLNRFKALHGSEFRTVFHDEKKDNKERENIVQDLHCTNCDFKTHSELVLTKHTKDCNIAIGKNSQVKDNQSNNSVVSVPGPCKSNVKAPNEQNVVNRKLTTKVGQVLEKKEKYKSTPELKTKRHCCYFCSKLIATISRHLQCKHKNEPEIKRILALPPSEKIMELKKLRRRGDQEYNAKVKSDRRIPVRKPLMQLISQCVECPKCSALIGKKNFSRHKRIC